MIHSFAATLFLGFPLIMYGGILSYLLFFAAAVVAILNRKGIRIIPFKWHPRLAIIAIAVATVHAIFGLSFYFGF
jgi:hypothetical protein